jgi:hypothetical protein
VIRCSRGNAAEMIARKLETKLRDRVLNNRSDFFLENASANAQRPRKLIDSVLLMDDSAGDFGSEYGHGIHALSHVVVSVSDARCAGNEVQSHHLHRTRLFKVPFECRRRNKGGRCARFTTWTSRISFGSGTPVSRFRKWPVRNCYLIAVLMALRGCGRRTKQVPQGRGRNHQIMWRLIARRNHCKVRTIDQCRSTYHSDAPMSAKNLKMAITALPTLTEKKRVIDMHMNIASALLKEIKSRALDTFIVTEESIAKQAFIMHHRY